MVTRGKKTAFGCPNLSKQHDEMCHRPLRRFLDILPGFPAVKPYLSVTGLSSFSIV